ncbi:PilZ domain-containing protein [Paenibacillus sp. CAA11]|uniref:PilZ domain-containing protein n=1 Tax=Paenibacillus sp. CAA11 TaxID=1532905 RepID=UPI000D3905D0|nr:PilZ domain-containing protein [Paenibacillus sp. CAA11]AWB43745.1 PilZ domain-containing protein [Paenibacillus sp. CAA11]
MSTNRRKTPFRYVLKEPVATEMHIISINGVPAPPKPIEALMHDISKTGCCLSIPLEIHVDLNQVRISLNVLLNEDPLYFEGNLQWDREEKGRFYYGVQLEIPEAEQDRLPRELRMLAGARRILVL